VSACAAAATGAGLYAGMTPWQAAMALIGAAACHALVALDGRAPHVPCDYIQTGEGAAGAFTLVAIFLFMSESPLVISLAVLAVILALQPYLRFAIAPEAEEAALSGAAIQAVAAVLAARIAWSASSELARPAGAALTGYIGSLQPGPLAPALALPAVAAAYALARLLAPELSSYSEGREFCCRPGRAFAITTACLTAARGVLVTITLLFSGWLCGIGLSAGRLYRGALPGAFNFMALVAFSQALLLLARLAGPFAAAVCAFAVSYGLFILYLIKRNVRYDRGETL
jgi:hypothetical protein